MLILTINSGSSSLRLHLFSLTGGDLVQRAQAHYQVKNIPQASALTEFLASQDRNEVRLVVHRVVHGGSQLVAPCLVDAKVEEAIGALNVLAPLHNPAALGWIRKARALLGEAVAQVAVFDTAFYRHLPAVAASYALPGALCRQHAIRRYGFHGIAHCAMLRRWQQRAEGLDEGGRVISVQLGSGCSITAIERGVAVDTSMGFSPLEGLVMATRCGDLDPAVVTYLQQQLGLDAAEVNRLLNEECGLLGLSGESGDMRALLASDTAGAALAVELYCYRVRKYIGAYLAVLGGADAILFGGGVGENSPLVRAKILQGFEWLGIALDRAANSELVGREGCITTRTSQTAVWVVAVDEARQMAEDGVNLIEQERV